MTSLVTATEGEADRRRRRVLAALLLSMGLAAIDTTIVATAVPSIVQDLGGFGSFPWVFSAYLLTQAITIPLYGRLADILGRKPVLLAGIAVFVFGSLLCGIAWSMPALIVFRAVQGLGAGAVQPVTTTIVADLYTLAERGRVQGYLSSVWGVTAVAGPALGGLLAQYGTWRWIFFINLPIGAVAAWLLHHELHESVAHRVHRMDYAGAATLAGGFGLTIFAVLSGGAGRAWTSAAEVGPFVAGLALIAIFVAIERRAAEPMVPGWVFTRRLLSTGNLSALCVGAVLFGLTSYLPPYAQGVLGKSPVVAGLTLAVISVSWAVAATSSSGVYLRLGFRNTALLGGVLSVAGTLLFTRLGMHASMFGTVGPCLVVGLGMGFAFTTVIVAVQSSVPWSERGVVTGANMFTRSIGSAVGVAVLGSIANRSLLDALHDAPVRIDSQVPHSLNGVTDVLGGNVLRDPAATTYVRHALLVASHRVFWALVVIAVVMLLAQLVMPREFRLADSEPG
jgi:EmrB/QacA subfamily drug resistance transporter